MIELLQEILDAGKDAKLPLDMTDWHCGTACCLCGDVAAKYNCDNLAGAAERFAGELKVASFLFFGVRSVAMSIYNPYSELRLNAAENSGIFTDEELKHPHLTTDHSDREIAHDFVRLVMRKCEEKMQEESTCTH